MRHDQDRRARTVASHNTRALTIRIATADDAFAVRRLEQLDGASSLAGEVLLAELDDAPLAAVSLETGAVAADPFQYSADAVRLLRLRRDQLLLNDDFAARTSQPVRRLYPRTAR